MNEMPKVLVVDDEAGLRAMIEDYLTIQGFDVLQAGNGAALDRVLATARPDVIVLDVNMPGEDGLSILSRLRGAGHRMGIVMLTANADEVARVAGLSTGADDYVVKPFELRELVARLRAVLRRLPQRPAEASRPGNALALGPCRLDLDGRRLFGADGIEIEVSSMEFDLLETFARHPRQILSRERLCELSHGRPLGQRDRSVDIRITRLRKKIETDPARPALLRTVRGEGYLFDPSAV